MPPDSEVLEAILEVLPNDDDWPDNVPVYKAYRLAGLKRYNLTGLQGFLKTKESTCESESLSASSSSSSNKLPVHVSPDAAIQIKIENSTAQRLQQSLTVCKSAKSGGLKVFKLQ